MALNLCQVDSKEQHHNSGLKNHHSIAVDKSNTTEMPNRMYAKLGMPF